MKLMNLQKSYLGLYASQIQKNSGSYTHVILPTDTLIGLAFKYNITVNDIKVANSLTSGNIHERSVLKIPIKQAPQFEIDDGLCLIMQRRLINHFKKETQIVEDSEALFYLQANNFHLQNSIEDFKQDQEWAKTHPFTPRPHHPKEEALTPCRSSKERRCQIFNLCQL